MNRTFVLTAAFVLASAAAGAQSPAAVFQPSLLTASRDSFVAFANGQPLGTAILSSSREGANFRFIIDLTVPAAGVHQKNESVFNATSLMPVSQAMDASIQGMTLTSRIDIAGGKAKGTAQSPSPTGITTATVDLDVPPGTIDDPASLSILATVDLKPGLKMSFKSLDDSPPGVDATEVSVDGTETVTVPAGAFEAYRLLLHAKAETVVFITTASPHRVVMIRINNGQVELRLAK